MKHLPIFLTLAIAFTAALPAKADTNIGTPILSVPFVINKPGKYRLTKNLSNLGNSTAILVNARDVVIDLNGFTLTGQTAGRVENVGILTRSQNTIIRNGTVRFFNTGITDASGANGILLEDISCVGQTSVGVRLAQFDAVLRRVAVRNVGTQNDIPEEIFGIFLSGSSVVENCVVLNIPARQGVSTNAAIFLGTATQSVFGAGSHSLREVDVHRVSFNAISVSADISTILERVRIRECGTGLRISGTQNPPLVRESTIRDCTSASVAGAFDDGGRNNIDQ